MVVGNTVFVEELGFGIILKKDNDLCKVYFYNDDKEIKIEENKLVLIEDWIVKYFIIKGFYDDFRIDKKYYTRELLVDYHIKNIIYNKNYFYADIEEKEKIYKVSLSKSSRKVYYDCNCNSYYVCYHLIALAANLSFIFRILENHLISKTKALTNEIIKNYEKAVLSDENLESAKEIIKELNNNDEDYLIKFINLLVLENGNETYDPLNKNICCILAYPDSLRKRIEKLLETGRVSIPAIFNRYLKNINSVAIKDTEYDFLNSSYNSYVDKSLYLLYNERYYEYLLYSLKDRNGIFSNYNYVQFASKYIEIDNRTLYLLQNVNQNSNIKNAHFYQQLLGRLPIEKRLEFYKDENGRIGYTYDDIKTLDVKNKHELFKNCIIYSRNVNDVIDNELYDNGIEDARILLKCLDVINENDINLYGIIINKMERLKDREYLIQYVNNRDSSFKNNYSSWYYKEHLLSKNKFDLTKIIPEKFLTYFNINFEVLEDDDYSFRIVYKVIDLQNKEVIKIKVDNKKYDVVLNCFSNVHDDIFTQFTVYYINTYMKAQLNEEIKKVEQRIADKIEDEQCKQALEEIKNVTDNYLTNSVILKDNVKAKLEYIFTIDQNFQLGLKIGIDKTYVVKDMQEFFNAFINNDTIAYGKSFTFRHNIENIDEKDKEILKLLLKCLFQTQYYRRSIIINEILFDSLIQMLKGRKVKINQMDYILRLNNINPKITIDKNYIINCSLNTNCSKIINTQKRMYILFDDCNCIDECNGNKNEIAFYNFALKYNGLRIKKIAKEVAQNLLIYYQNEVEVAEEVKEDFKLSIVTIKAYFDYNKGVITVNKEYYKDEHKINSADASDNDMMKINLFNQYLSSIGFIEDEIVDEGNVLSFFYMEFNEMRRYCDVYLSESIKNKQISFFAPKPIRIQYDGVIMKALMGDSKYNNDELEAIMKAIKQKKKYVLLSNDRIINVDNEASKEFYETVEDLKLNPKKLTEETPISLVQSLKAFAHKESCTIDDYLENMVNEISNFKNSDISIPKINGELREYQKEGFKWLSILSKYNVGGILADDMGLGKTLEIISLIVSSKANKPSLVICPKTLVFNWKNEFARFASDIVVKEIYGNKQDRNDEIANINPNEKCVYICSYDSLRNDMEQYKNIFEYLVIDEAQYIKNVNALKTISVKKLKANHKIALTGTPIENNIIYLWSIFDFVIPGYFEEISLFKSKYTASERFVETVSKRIAPFVLRRTKENVLKDLPEKYETVLSVDMEKEQRKLYDAYKKEISDKIENGAKAFDILPYLTRLRQICVNPNMFVENYKGNVAKMELLDTLLDGYIENNHKLLIFSQFVKALKEVEELLIKKKIPYYMITGETDGKRRIAIADSFNNDSKEKIVLISLKAGGTGLNLIGADTVIHLDPWWNVAAENQASDRTHRIGQKNNVEVIKIICSNSIEQRVIELQNVKKDLIDRVISNDDNSVSNSSIEDIKFILD